MGAESDSKERGLQTPPRSRNKISPSDAVYSGHFSKNLQWYGDKMTNNGQHDFRCQETKHVF